MQLLLNSHGLDVLPRRNITRVSRRASIKAQTISNISRRNRSVLNGDKHLPFRRVGSIVGTSHETSCSKCVRSQWPKGTSGSVGKGALDRASRDISGMSLGEWESAGWVDVDFLAAWNFDVLLRYSLDQVRGLEVQMRTYHSVGIGKDGLGAWRARVDVRRAVGSGWAAQVEFLAGSIHREQMDGRSRS